MFSLNEIVHALPQRPAEHPAALSPTSAALLESVSCASQSTPSLARAAPQPVPIPHPQSARATSLLLNSTRIIGSLRSNRCNV